VSGGQKSKKTCLCVFFSLKIVQPPSEYFCALSNNDEMGHCPEQGLLTLKGAPLKKENHLDRWWFQRFFFTLPMEMIQFDEHCFFK